MVRRITCSLLQLHINRELELLYSEASYIFKHDLANIFGRKHRQCTVKVQFYWRALNS